MPFGLGLPEGRDGHVAVDTEAREGLRPHRKHEFSAFAQLLEADKQRIEGEFAAVEHGFLHIDVLGRIAFGAHDQRLASTQSDLGRLHSRAADREVSSGRVDLIQAESREDIPCRHLTAVFVAADAVFVVEIEVVHNVADDPGAFVLLPGHEVVHVCDVVARLVAVGILAHEAGHIGYVVAHVALGHEQAVEFLDESVGTSEKTDQAGNVVGHEEGVLPAVALGVVIGHPLRLEGVERLAELAREGAAAHEAADGVEVLLIGPAAPCETLECGGIAKCLRDLGHGAVGDAELHRLGDGLAFGGLVVGDETVGAVGEHSPVVELGGCLHGLKCSLGIFCVALEDEVAHRDYARVADHAVGLVAVEVPDGELALLAEDVEVGVGERGRELRVDNRRQRNLGAVGVPQGKNRVLGLVAVVDLPVGPTVAPVDIAVEGGEDHSVVERGVEDFLLTRIHGLDLDTAEGLVPLGVCLLGRPVEVPARKLFAKVVPCTFAAHWRESDLYEYLLVRGCVEKKHIGRTVILKLLDSLPCDGLAELCREVPCVVLGPSARAAEALDMGAVHDGEPAVETAVPADTGGEVHEDGGLVALKGVFVEADALGSGKAHLHSVVRKLQRVEAGPDALQGVVEVGVDVPDLLLLLDNPALGADGLGGVVGQQ